MDAAYLRKSDLEAQLSTAPAPEPLRFHPGISKACRTRVGQLIRGLGDAEDQEKAKEAIRALAEKIKLVPTKDANCKPALSIHLYGTLEGLLRLATGRPVARRKTRHGRIPKRRPRLRVRAVLIVLRN